MWEIIDQVLLGDGVNEDAWGVEGNLAWVVDGSSSVSSERVVPDWESDGRWLVDRLCESFTQSGEASSDETLELVLGRAIQFAATCAVEDWTGTPPVQPSAAVGLVRKVPGAIAYLVLADVSIIGRVGREAEEVSDQRADDGNVTARNALLTGVEDGRPMAEIRRELEPLLLAHRLDAMNQPGGYWVASLDEEAVAHALSGEFVGASEVALATDGFMRSVRPFHLISDFDRLFAGGGTLGELALTLRKMEREDGDCREFPRWNESDDLCAVHLRWQQDSQELSGLGGH